MQSAVSVAGTKYRDSGDRMHYGNLPERLYSCNDFEKNNFFYKKNAKINKFAFQEKCVSFMIIFLEAV